MRTSSRIFTVSLHVIPPGCTAVEKVKLTALWRGNQAWSRNTVRAPRIATGTTGTPAFAASAKAPV
jgi:hypothetical protein